MNTWNSIAWFPICIGLTGAGLVLSWFTWRRRGVRRGIRVGAWSLVPLALYLTGSILLVGRIGSAVVQFAQSFVFSPKTWSGVALLGLAALILLLSGGIPLLTSGRKRARKKELRQATKGTQSAATTGSTVALTAARGDQATASAGAAADKQAERGADHDGLDSDVAEILRRRGIN
ncbi:MAG TPA: cellulose synthase [Streptosporangiaceae bacterium]|nr:cellulose synthase [Streptosporangiaceae bacterium]